MAERMLGTVCSDDLCWTGSTVPEEKVRWVGWGEDGLDTSDWCILREGLSQGG